MPLCAELVGVLGGGGLFKIAPSSKRCSVSQPRTQTIEISAHYPEEMTEAMWESG